MPVLQEIKVPLLSVNDTFLTVVSVLFARGHAVRKGEILMVFETSKTTYDVPAEADGYVAYDCEEGSEYAVNTIVARIYSAAEEIPAVQMTGAMVQQTQAVLQPESQWTGVTIFSGIANQLIEQHGLDRSVFAGMDFVSRADVEERLGIAKQKVTPAKPQSPVRPAAQKLSDFPADGSVKVEKVSKYKAREIDYLGEVQSTGLTSTIHVQLDTTGIFEAVNPSFRYFRNSLLPLLLYEVSRLLRKYPALNAYYADGQIGYYQRVVPGFAIDIERGLKVVAVHAAGDLELTAMEETIYVLSEKYLDDKLDFSDLTGITFTITDLSAEGVHSFIPLVNRANSAILGVSSVDPRTGRCMLSLTFDHRVTEGRHAAVFLRELAGRVESYAISKEATLVSGINCHKCMKSLKDDLGRTGFVKCVTPQGKEGYICQSCLNGF